MSHTVKRRASHVQYSQEIAQTIAHHLANGLSYRAIGAMKGMPDDATLWRWEDTHPEFAVMLARAKRTKAANLVSDGLAFLDEVDPDAKFGSARVTKAREQANYRRWLAGCLDRSTYGDKLDVKAEATVALVAFGDLTQSATLAAAAITRTQQQLPRATAPDGAEEG